MVIIGWCMRYRIYAITEIGQDILKDMRFSIFEHLQNYHFLTLTVGRMENLNSGGQLHQYVK